MTDPAKVSGPRGDLHSSAWSGLEAQYDSSVTYIQPAQGLRSWHPGKLVLLWAGATLLLWFGWTLEFDPVILVGLLSIVVSFAVTWRWLSARESRAPRLNESLRAEREAIESLVWAAVASLRRLEFENASVEQGSRIPRDQLRSEGFVLVCAAVKAATEIVFRDNDASRRRVGVQFSLRLANLSDPVRGQRLLEHAKHRMPSYDTALAAAELDKLDTAVGRVWATQFPRSDLAASALAILIFGRLFKYAVSDVLKTLLPLQDADVLRVVKVEFDEKWPQR
jgi:hypothetical protein